MAATVAAIHLNEKSRAPLRRVDRVNATADSGLDGDRHARPGRRRQVLIVEQEVLDEFSLQPGDVREQITVRDVKLYDLEVGARLRAGTVVLEAQEPCAPCARMDELRPGLKDAIDGRRGRFFRVVEAGSFAVGDKLELESASTT